MRPPSHFPPGHVELLREGDLCDLYFEDGWWEVEVKAVARCGEAKTIPEPLPPGSRRRRRGDEDDYAKPASLATSLTSSAGASSSAAAAGPSSSTALSWSKEVGGGLRLEAKAARAAKVADGERRFLVESVRYKDHLHKVAEGSLRPRWLWSAEARAWRYELQQGHGCVPVDEEECPPFFQFALGVLRSFNS